MESRQRDLCFRCLKPAVTCFCGQLRPVRTRTDLVFLQHPTERKRTVGTARMAHLCIANSRLIVGREFRENLEVRALMEDPARDCVILYPGRESQDIQSSGWQPPAHRRLTVFLVDGTWCTAGKMLRASPNLLRLPQIRFNPQRASEYRFRAQPEPHCVSTVEATHALLGILEPEVDAGNLLEIFRAMVATQVRYGELNLIRRVANAVHPAT